MKLSFGETTVGIGYPLDEPITTQDLHYPQACVSTLPAFVAAARFTLPSLLMFIGRVALKDLMAPKTDKELTKLEGVIHTPFSSHLLLDAPEKTSTPKGAKFDKLGQLQWFAKCSLVS